VQVAQVICPPHPLLTGPHRATPPEVQACVAVKGVQMLTPLSVKSTPPSGSGVALAAPQTPWVPPPPQVSPAGQAEPASVALHDTTPPQPSAITPQFIFVLVPGTTHAAEAVNATQPWLPPHWLAVPPPPQVCVPVHVTHGAAINPPHPSAC
jgi:hypothetical protein